MRLRVISTTYNSQKTIDAFLNSLNKSVDLPEVELPVQLIVVNDGSRDSTLKILLSSIQPNLKITVLDLARNYGHHQAIFAGIRELDDDFDFLIIIDSDLEEDPGDITRLIQVIQNTNSDVVITYLSKRTNKLTYRFIAKMVDVIIRLVLGSNYVPRVCTLRIMQRHVAQQLKKNTEINPVLGLAQQRLGLNTTKMLIQKSSKGTSEYTFSKKAKVFFQMLGGVSDLHSRLALFLAITGFSFSMFCGAWLLYNRINTPNVIASYTSTALLITFFLGIIIFLTSLNFRLLMRLISINSGDSGVVIRMRHEK